MTAAKGKEQGAKKPAPAPAPTTDFVLQKMVAEANELVGKKLLAKGQLTKVLALKDDGKRFERLLELIREAKGEGEYHKEEDSEEPEEMDKVVRIGRVKKELGEIQEGSKYVPAEVVEPIMQFTIDLAREVHFWNGHISFLESLNEQFRRYNHLTVKQVRALINMLERYTDKIPSLALEERYNELSDITATFKQMTWSV